MPIERYEGPREALLTLFALADDSPVQIASYVGLGDVLVARQGEAVIGHAQIVVTDEPGVLELKSLAVLAEHRGAGIGRELVAAAIAFSRERCARSLIVSTATADIANLRFYQRRGFRMTRIVPDAFRPETGYPHDLLIGGILLRDQVFFELKLAD
ncbi:GNAT family N-acetyltransferase [Labrys sp. KNU-23]|uniref:GNAT family N-acetyltransferase n=1 Tax=Labrys sp. KNU-23 TaxID=2789216 RepID=UPI0011ECC471|nr:GNAT family N-acetyltransferase [Labrys sp. KNU-23]QEN87837.1 GNAT family N-acetyltransferase [Labrys sp. KNU-23]